MSATLSSSPSSMASAYRPIEYRIQRSDPANSRVYFIRPATASDVATLGSGLEEGDILVQHQAWAGPVPGVAGQTILFDDDCEVYAGVWTVLSTFTALGDLYSVIDAPDLGTFTGSPFGSARVYLDNYVIWCRLRVWTDPNADPSTVYLPASPDETGLVTFNVAPTLAVFFSEDIELYARPWSGTIIQSAHGLTALTYRATFFEVYSSPGVTAALDPWQDGTEVHDDEADLVAVNAVHPYHAELTTWGSATLSDFAVGSSSRKFLTYAPRTITIGENDLFRLHILSGSVLSFNHFLEVREVNPDGTTTLVGSYNVAVSGTVAAVSIGVGPADLSPLLTVPDRYRVRLLNSEDAVISESFEFVVDRTCKENRRPIGWLGKLGGVDLYTFTGREIETSSATRITVSKRMGSGTGFDYATRGFRSEPRRVFTNSTGAIGANVRGWLSRELCESANVVLKLSDTLVTPIVLTSNEHLSANSGGVFRPLTITYVRGTDNEAQDA